MNTAAKPEENVTLESVDDPEHAILFTVAGRLSAHREGLEDSMGVQVLLDSGATSDFMSMKTAQSARLPLYKPTRPGHVLAAGGVQVEVRYYARAYVRIGNVVFRHHFKVLEILPDVVLGLPWLRSYNPVVNWVELHADVRQASTSY